MGATNRTKARIDFIIKMVVKYVLTTIFMPIETHSEKYISVATLQITSSQISLPRRSG